MKPLIRADLHIHTNYSADSTINPKTLIDQLNAHPTIKAIAITDHNTTEGYYHAKQLASAYTDTLIIPAAEITTTQGDIIILGTVELPPKPWTPQNITNHAKQNNAITIAAHPYRTYGLGENAKNYQIDAIETLNGTSPTHINKMAENLAKTLNLPGVAGSDAHNTDELWTVYTEIQAPPDINEILKAIKKGKVKTAYAPKSIHF
ncbi:MAG: PHP domain-containing protein [Candidatus Bathyarchaeota archaeon]|jgi:predicted metal-dependent phosphoesterase TrpH|nr:PHP domain-containing protein [Candidatus Bathyarchaeota archaeon A05DMB-5]MDH7557614.1 PHP domain-containing protein [Candidatus Bathyarchaeota archaeon]